MSNAPSDFDHAKIAEEIKLNVAAVGMDLLNNSSAGGIETIESKMQNRDSTIEEEKGFTADDETSPMRRRNSKERGLPSVNQLQNSDDDSSPANKGDKVYSKSMTDSEEEDTLNETRDEMDQEMDIAKRLRQTNFKHIDLPPPLELIAKSAYKEDEPVKTGAPIAFVSLAQMAGG